MPDAMEHVMETAMETVTATATAIVTETATAKKLSELYADTNHRVATGTIADEAGFVPPSGMLVCGFQLMLNDAGDLNEDLLDTLVSFGLLAGGAKSNTERCEPVLELDSSIEVDGEYLVFLGTNCKFSVALLDSQNEEQWKAAAKKIYMKSLQTPQFAGSVYPVNVAAEPLILESLGAAVPANSLRQILRGEAALDRLLPATAKYQYAQQLAGPVTMKWAEEVAQECLLEHFGQDGFREMTAGVAQACAQALKPIRERVVQQIESAKAGA